MLLLLFSLILCNNFYGSEERKPQERRFPKSALNRLQRKNFFELVAKAAKDSQTVTNRTEENAQRFIDRNPPFIFRKTPITKTPSVTKTPSFKLEDSKTGEIKVVQGNMGTKKEIFGSSHKRKKIISNMDLNTLYSRWNQKKQGPLYVVERTSVNGKLYLENVSYPTNYQQAIDNNETIYVVKTT